MKYAKFHMTHNDPALVLEITPLKMRTFLLISENSCTIKSHLFPKETRVDLRHLSKQTNCRSLKHTWWTAALYPVNHTKAVHWHLMHVTRKQTLTSLSLSYPKKDCPPNPSLGMTTTKALNSVFSWFASLNYDLRVEKMLGHWMMHLSFNACIVQPQHFFFNP